MMEGNPIIDAHQLFDLKGATSGEAAASLALLLQFVGAVRKALVVPNDDSHKRALFQIQSDVRCGIES